MISVFNRGHFLSVPLRSFLVKIVYHVVDFSFDLIECDTLTEIEPVFAVAVSGFWWRVVDAVSLARHRGDNTTSFEYRVLEVCRRIRPDPNGA